MFSSFVWCNWICACIPLSSWWFNFKVLSCLHFHTHCFEVDYALQCARLCTALVLHYNTFALHLQTHPPDGVHPDASHSHSSMTRICLIFFQLDFYLFCPSRHLLVSVQDLKRSCKNLHKKRLDTSLAGHYLKYAKMMREKTPSTC